jgi:hypothetical protein
MLERLSRKRVLSIDHFYLRLGPTVSIALIPFLAGRKLGAHRAHRGPGAHPCVALDDLLSGRPPRDVRDPLLARLVCRVNGRSAPAHAARLPAPAIRCLLGSPAVSIHFRQLQIPTLSLD